MKTLTLIICLVAATAVCQAQSLTASATATNQPTSSVTTHTSNQHSIEARVNKAVHLLGLCSEQMEVWQEVLEKYDPQLAEAIEKRDHHKARVLRKQIDHELKAVLSDEQAAQYDEMRGKRTKKGRSKR